MESSHLHKSCAFFGMMSNDVPVFQKFVQTTKQLLMMFHCYLGWVLGYTWLSGLSWGYPNSSLDGLGKNHRWMMTGGTPMTLETSTW